VKNTKRPWVAAERLETLIALASAAAVVQKRNLGKWAEKGPPIQYKGPPITKQGLKKLEAHPCRLPPSLQAFYADRKNRITF
jgi:hypothetical protein